MVVIPAILSAEEKASPDWRGITHSQIECLPPPHVIYAAMLDLLFAVPSWLKFGVALAVLGYSTYALTRGILWPWGWGIGISILVLAFLPPLRPPGHRRRDS